MAQHIPITIPLVLLFIASFAITAAYNVMNVLIVDLYYSTPATAMAANNLVRCLLGAAATAIVHPMIKAVGRGWTYTYVGLIVVSVVPILVLVLLHGLRWRKKGEASGL